MYLHAQSRTPLIRSAFLFAVDWDELEEIKLCPGLEDGEQASLTNYLTCLYNDRMLVALCKSESGGQDIIAVSYHGNNNCAYMKKQKYW